MEQPDAETAAFLREFAALAAQAPPDPTIHERRAALDWMADAFGPPKARVARMRERTIPGPGGPVPLRIYWPAGAGAQPPVMLHIHGGGWALGGPKAYERVCRALCEAGGCIVVDVDYRRAPEHRFPAALEDCETALAWTAAHAAELGGDPGRLVVCGDCPGGALAGVVCQRAKHPVALQVLVYPVMTSQAAAAFPSRRRLGDGRFFLREFDIKPTARVGVPRTRIELSTISRSDSFASSWCAAMRSAWSFTSRVAPTAAPVAIVAAREPPVEIVLNGVAPESPPVVWTAPPSEGATCGASLLAEPTWSEPAWIPSDPPPESLVVG